MAQPTLPVQKPTDDRTQGSGGRQRRGSRLNKYFGELNEILFCYFINHNSWQNVESSEVIRRRIGKIRGKIGGKAFELQVSRAESMARFARDWLAEEGVRKITSVGLASKPKKEDPWNPSDVFVRGGRKKIGFSLKSSDRKKHTFRCIGLGTISREPGLASLNNDTYKKAKDLSWFRSQLWLIYSQFSSRCLADHILSFWFGSKENVDFVQIVGSGDTNHPKTCFSRIHLAQDKLRRFGAEAKAVGNHSIKIFSKGDLVLTIRFKLDSLRRGSIKLHADV